MSDRRARIEYESYETTSYYVSGTVTKKTVKVPRRIERIQSDDDASTRYLFAKGCTHLKLEAETFPVTQFIYYYGSLYRTDVNVVESDYGVDPSLQLNRMVSQLQLANPSDWDQVVEKVTGQLRNQFSLINFLLELREVPELFHKWKGISDFWLRWSFGIAPMISDAKALADQMKVQLLKLNGLNDRLQKGLRCGTSRPIYWQETVVTGDQGELEFTLTCKGRRRWTCLATGSFHSNLVTRFLDALGFYPTWSTAWNAVPFSFIIDYFIPIGKALESQESSWSEFSAGLSMASESFKVNFIGELKFRSLDNTSATSSYTSRTLGGPVLRRVTGTYYVRIPHDNAVLDGVDFDTGSPPLSKKRQANLAALAISNLKDIKAIGPFLGHLADYL